MSDNALAKEIQEAKAAAETITVPKPPDEPLVKIKLNKESLPFTKHTSKSTRGGTEKKKAKTSSLNIESKQFMRKLGKGTN